MDYLEGEIPMNELCIELLGLKRFFWLSNALVLYIIETGCSNTCGYGGISVKLGPSSSMTSPPPTTSESSLWNSSAILSGFLIGEPEIEGRPSCHERSNESYFPSGLWFSFRGLCCVDITTLFLVFNTTVSSFSNNPCILLYFFANVYLYLIFIILFINFIS